MSIQEQKITDAAIAASGVQSQPDKLTGTAAQNKAVFDRLVTAVVKERFNALLDELTGEGCAAQLGVETIPGLSAETVQAALEQIMTNMQGITQGGVTDGSVTLAKLAGEVTAAALGGAAARHTHSAGEIVSGVLDAARIPVLDETKLGGAAVKTSAIAPAAVTGDKIAAGAVQAVHIAPEAVTAQKLAAGAVSAEKLAADAVRLVFTDIAVPAEAFAADETQADFPYRADIALAGVTAAMTPEVVFGASDAVSGNFAPVAGCYAGGVRIYAAEAPAETVVIPTILAWR